MDPPRSETRRSWSRYTDAQLTTLSAVRSDTADPFAMVIIPLERIGLISPGAALTMLAIVLAGVVPLAVMTFGQNDLWSFWALALYASALWAGLFLIAYHAQGARAPVAAALFAATALGSTGVLLFALAHGLDAQRAPLLASPHRGTVVVSYVVLVGVVEETLKVVPVIALAWLTFRNLAPLRLFLFYGLMSGLGFGIYEGVAYQVGQNVEDANGDLTVYYITNIVRLTSAPFLHAVWTGTAAVFLWFALRFRGDRLIWHRTLAVVLGIAIPSVLHGVYDWLAAAAPRASVVIPVISVGLLGLYVGSADAIERAIELRGERVAALAQMHGSPSKPDGTT